MKPTILMAVAGSMLIHGVNVCKQHQSADVFSKADKSYQQKKCNQSTQNNKAKCWRSCRSV